MSDGTSSIGHDENGCCRSTERRATVVSFSRDKDEISIARNRGHDDDVVVDKDSGDDEEEDDECDEALHLALGPYIQSYLAHGGQSLRCCGICCPIPFERASRRSWWDPRFDSEILEGQYRRSSFSQITVRFRYALAYMISLGLIWCAHLITIGYLDRSQTEAFPLGVLFFFFAVFCFGTLIFTWSAVYRRYSLPVSLVTSTAMCLLSIVSIGQSPVLSPASDFAICIEILMLVYAVIPLPLYACVILCCLYSVAFEFLTSNVDLPVRIFCHVSVHIIAFHIFIMTNVRMRGTFMRVGQSLLVRRQLEMEKQLKEQMILSVMPPSVADWLLKEEDGYFFGSDINPLFRPFNMSCMKDVSILFADIVGFTRMSSNKTASELVSLLNDLFERFDHLCVQNGCEKISTLGDCYYCVSGCPTPRADHAKCCVEMGLGMIKAIAEFDRDKKENVNMRVGVHTGTVLCGLVGRRRFKFDVWSNDVTLANKMESTGQPGRVHISGTTKNFLNDEYLLEKSDDHNGLETYFIVSRKQCNQHPRTSIANSISNEPQLIVNITCSGSMNGTSSPSEIRSDPKLLSSSASPSPLLSARPSHLNLSLSDRLMDSAKASSMPNVFNKETKSCTELTSTTLGSGSILPRKNQLLPPSWTYNRLRLSNPERENGNVQKVYKFVPHSESPSNKQAAHTQLEVPKDDLSYCQSTISRKDSGIRSNSRRSSIQQQLYLVNGAVPSEMTNHRVSGYYTSSQSSLEGRTNLPPPLTDSLGACFKKIRKQSDLQLIKCVQDNSRTDNNYFETPPLKRWSLLFKQPNLEKEYRERAHISSPSGLNKSRTLATARFSTYFDICVSLIVFSLVSVSIFLLLPPSTHWMVSFLTMLCVQIVILGLCFHSIFRPVVTNYFRPFLRWYQWHVLGGTLVSLPIIAVLVNFDRAPTSQHHLFYFTFLVFVGFVHYCNFTQLNCWIKSTLATVCGLIYLFVVTYVVLTYPELINGVGNVATITTTPTITTNHPTILPVFDVGDDGIGKLRVERASLYRTKIIEEIYPTDDDDDEYNEELESMSSVTESSALPRESPPRNATRQPIAPTVISPKDAFLVEIYVDVFLLVLLVWFLNREFEISYRLSFHGDAVAAKDRAKVEAMKLQADYLLDNIIPKHVAEQIKITARYSEDVKNAGIIFASIINFGELYDEAYMDGKEYLRVLNELVSDFDELLSQPRFHMVEKIKTIGSTFMAASGLNLSQRKKESNEHLIQLMEFAFALQAAVDNFNAHLLSFKLLLRVGYNFGDVTAGVIGTTKLYYDIWGDAVNIASRMDSTGVACRIQVPASCLPILDPKYEFEHRGTVFVKGKDDMDVYLIKGRKEDCASSSSCFFETNQS